MTTSAGNRSKWILLAVAALVVPVEVVGLLSSDRLRTNWSSDPSARAVIVSHVVAALAAAAGGAVMVWRRPANRCGRVAILLAVIWAAWFVAVFQWGDAERWKALVPIAVLYLLRPVLLYLVLAYPIGRLDRVSRLLYTVYIAGTAAVFAITLGTYDPFDARRQQFTLWRSSSWNRLVFSAWWDVAALVMVATVLVVVRRRTLKFPGAGARIAKPAFWAAAVAVGADVVLILTGTLDDLFIHLGVLTPFGMAVEVIDYLRYGAVVAILAFGAWRAWPRDATTAHSVDLGSGIGDTMTDALARVLGDATATVAMIDASGTWRDLDGAPRAEPTPDRAVTILTEADAPVAALEYDDVFAPHPALLEAAAAALALQVESAHQTVVAQDREAQLRILAGDVLDAEDAARSQLERDLHDGAQQALVGLALHAALAARTSAASGNGSPEATDLAAAIEATRAELLALASGRPPALLAQRGLDGALGALVLTSGLPVTVSVDPCLDLPEPLQRAIWFTASEAVTNVLKHADASTMRLTLARSAARVVLTIEDDGRGGVVGTPQALSARVAEADGALEVSSNGFGTRVEARFATVVTP